MNLLPMKCLVIALALTCANVHAKGVAAVKAQSYHDDAKASVFMFESVSATSVIITFDIKGQKPYSIIKSDKLAYVEVVDRIGDITKDSDIEPYRKSLKECEVFTSKYTKSKPLLTPYIEMISGVVEKYDNGQVKKGGEWMEKYLLASKAPKPKDSDSSVKWKTLTLNDGKTYQNVSLLKKMPHQISILHDGGAARIPYENLTSDTQKELGGFDPEKAAEARKRDSEAKQLDAVRYKKADKILEEKRVADLAEQKEINEMREEKRRRDQLAKIERRKLKNELKDTKKREFFVTQVVDGGVLAVGAYRNIISSRSASVGGGGGAAVVGKKRGSTISFLRCDTNDLHDGKLISGFAVPDGTFSYTTILGAAKTVKAYKYHALGE